MHLITEWRSSAHLCSSSTWHFMISAVLPSPPHSQVFLIWGCKYNHFTFTDMASINKKVILRYLTQKAFNVKIQNTNYIPELFNKGDPSTAK